MGGQSAKRRIRSYISYNDASRLSLEYASREKLSILTLGKPGLNIACFIMDSDELAELGGQALRMATEMRDVR